MVVSSAAPGPFDRGEPEPEGDYVACLLVQERLSGFLSLRRTTLRTRTKLWDPETSQDVIRWRVSLSPREPWDEGYQNIEEAQQEAALGEFTYRGTTYEVRWVGVDVADWVVELVLSD